MYCSKCGKETLPENLMGIVTEDRKYYYCRVCIKQARDNLSMQLFKNKDTRKLLKDIRKFLESETKN